MIDGRTFYLGGEPFPISLGFGEVVPATAAYGPHTGLDVAAPVGTPVPALLEGRVESVRTTPLGGLQVLVRARGGASALFAHLSEADVAPGEPVTPQTFIGRSGASGSAVIGPHLHVETRSPAGTLVDPRQLLGDRAGAGDCPPGYVRSIFGACVRAGFVPDVGPLPTLPLLGEDFGTPERPNPKAPDQSVDLIGGAIGGAVSAVAVLGVVVVLGILGARRLLGG